jgi:hypothetical protein
LLLSVEYFSSSSFPFTLHRSDGCSGSLFGSQSGSIFEIVFFKKEHKWRRILDPLTFPLTPRSKIESLMYEGVPDTVRADVWTALIRSNNLPRTDDM